MATRLPTVAIIGRANAGKSSLFNRMVRAQQAIVAREAGTTRDNVVGKVEHQHHQFWLVDTAGLKPAEDEFEATIQDQIEDAAAAAADVILVVIDSTQYVGDEERAVAKKSSAQQKASYPRGQQSGPTRLISRQLSSSALASKRSFAPVPSIAAVSPTCSMPSSATYPATYEEAPSDILRIALIGRPNVGKSYLFNTLAGKQQAIVANVAGTTRDLNRITP
jgi:GTP-binding protein